MFLILAGAALFLDNIGLWSFHEIWRYWPLALIAVGASKLFTSRGPAGLLWAILLVLSGLVFLLNNLGLLALRLGTIWPLILVGLGALMLVRALERRPLPGKAPVSTSNSLREWVVFGATKRRVEAPDFQGGELLAIFGEIHVDLRRASFPASRGEVIVDANATFGAIDIKVPETWSVALRGIGIFGAYEDKTIASPIEYSNGAPKLVITGYAVFGSVIVRH